jgi:DNA repair protein RadC
VKRLSAIEHARHTYRRRQHRRELIGSPDLFGEPAWDMMIYLFIHTRDGTAVATSTLCSASTATPSTALRLINKLCEAGLMRKVDDPKDGRRQFVELTAEAAKRLETYFGADEN